LPDGSITTTYVFGAKTPIDLNDVYIHMVFDQEIVKIERDVVSNGPVFAAGHTCENTNDLKGFVYKTDNLRSSNYIQIKIHSKRPLKIIKVILKP